MSFDIITTPHFEREAKVLAKRYKSFKNDFIDFVNSLRDHPIQGAELGSGIRKVRMAIASKGKGKAGGSRVITYTVCISEKDGKIYLVDIYDKSDYSTVDVKIIKKIIENLEF